MRELRSLKPLLIYRIPDQIGLFRSFGLFCLGHSVVWTGITWSWFTGRSKLDSAGIHLNKWKKSWFKSGDVSSSDQPVCEVKSEPKSTQAQIPKFLQSLENYFQSVRNSNAESATEFVNKFQPLVDSISNFSQQNRTRLLCCLGALSALTTLVGGYFLPRRVVRQLKLLPIRPSASSSNSTVTSRMQQLVEITTYDAYGLRALGTKLIVPVSSIRTNLDHQKKHFVTFQVQNHIFPFILQTEDAEFPDPEEFEYTFVSGSQH